MTSTSFSWERVTGSAPARAGEIAEVIFGDDLFVSIPFMCSCQARPADATRYLLIVTMGGCPVHAPELYWDRLASRFDLSPHRIGCSEDPTTPNRVNIAVDGKNANLPKEEGLRLLREYRALMDEISQRFIEDLDPKGAK